jgi:outer membrane protein, multidrug efflux system
MSSEIAFFTSSQVGIEEFFDDPMLTSLIDQALVGNRELKILGQDVRIGGDEIPARGVPSLRHDRVRRGAEQTQPPYA